jgi:hypothetical protein
VVRAWIRFVCEGISLSASRSTGSRNTPHRLITRMGWSDLANDLGYNALALVCLALHPSCAPVRLMRTNRAGYR